MSSELPSSVREFRARARTQLAHEVWESVDGGAEDERAIRRNRLGFHELALRPFRLVDVRARTLGTTVLGHSVGFPVMLAPAGIHRLVHPDGELATARAAAAMDTIMCLATGASYSIEDVAAAADGPKWFQLYHLGRDYSDMLVRRAEAAGYQAICVTVDVPLPHRAKERDRRNAFDPFHGLEQANFVGEAAGLGLVPGSPEATRWPRPPFRPTTWSDLGWLRTRTALPIVVKGILTWEDAAACAAAGFEGIVVSNHGGRMQDAVVSTIEVLPEIVDAVSGRCEVYLDGGVRRGSDVVKALALGARACMIGRPFLWGLAVAGEQGVRHVLKLLRDEIDHTLAFCGRPDVSTVNRDLVRVPAR